MPSAQISGRPLPLPTNGLSLRDARSRSRGVTSMRRILPSRRSGFCAVVVRVVHAPAVAEADVEHAVGAELELPAVVVLVRLVDREQDALGGRVGVLRLRVDVQLGDDRLDLRAVLDVVIDVEQAVLCELRVEGDAEQAALVVHQDLRRDVEVRRLVQLAVLVQPRRGRAARRRRTARRGRAALDRPVELERSRSSRIRGRLAGLVAGNCAVAARDAPAPAKRESDRSETRRGVCCLIRGGSDSGGGGASPS